MIKSDYLVKNGNSLLHKSSIGARAMNCTIVTVKKRSICAL